MASTFRERRFPPAEVRRILRRAAEIAEIDPETAAVERTLTQDELTRQAAELGLPASAVQRAIGAPSASQSAPTGRWLKPRTILLEQDLPGEVPAERHEDIVDAIRAAAGTSGRTEVIGKTLSWFIGPTIHPLVTVRARDGRTHVRVEDRLHGIGMLIAFSTIAPFPSLMAGAIALGVSRSHSTSVLVGFVVMACCLFVASALAARIVRRREALLHRVMDRTCAAATAAIQPPSSLAPAISLPVVAALPIDPPAPAPAGPRIVKNPGVTLKSRVQVNDDPEAEATSEAEASAGAGKTPGAAH